MIFTIAIPTYNNASTIEETLKSCISQNFDDTFEILVVNNNSTDNTEKILSRYDEKIRIIKNNETVSMYQNHNICLQKAKGDYVIFCHSDDQLLPDALKKYHDILKKRNYPERYVLWGRSMFRDFYYSWKAGGYLLNQVASGINSLNAFQFGGLTPSGTCYSRLSLLSIGGFTIVNHKIAPSDLVSLWKFSINYFEFEMADRIFFIRESASTASGQDFNLLNVKKSLLDAIQCLFKELTIDQQAAILNHFQHSEFYSPRIFNILISLHLVDKKIIRRKTVKYLLKHPFAYRRKEVLKLLF